MATRNSYLAYKQDTSRIIYWIVGTSNAIIRNLRARRLPIDDDLDVPSEINASCAVTTTDLVALSTFISRHVTTTPPAILRLFQSVIDARSAA